MLSGVTVSFDVMPLFPCVRLLLGSKSMCFSSCVGYVRLVLDVIFLIQQSLLCEELVMLSCGCSWKKESVDGDGYMNEVVRLFCR